MSEWGIKMIMMLVMSRPQSTIYKQGRSDTISRLLCDLADHKNVKPVLVCGLSFNQILTVSLMNNLPTSEEQISLLDCTNIIACPLDSIALNSELKL